MTLLNGKAAVAAMIVVLAGSAVIAGQTPQSQPSTNLQSANPYQSVDQSAILSNPGGMTLHWTAPGDDGNVGTADHYVVKYSSNLITESNWASATTIPNPPTPLPAGSAQSFAFSGLSRGTQYYFAVKTYDDAGNVSALSNVIRKFTGGIVTPPPRTAAVDSVRGIVTLAADTVAAAQRLLYQFAVDTSASFPNPRMAADSLVHSPASVSYTNLARNDTYFWRVRAIFLDRTDTSLWSVTNSFIMPAAPRDSIPPVISGIRATNIASNSATISWTTNEAASSQVEYGTSISYGSSTTLDPSLVTSHSQNLVNLAPSTTYHFRVKSADAAGNLAVSGDNTFTTTSNSMQLLSQGVPVAASGTFPGYNTAVINDGTIAPRGGTSSTWASDQSANPHWVEFTFNSPVTVQRMRVYWAYNAYLARFMGSQQYNIQYWDATSGSYLNAATVNNTTQDSVTTTDFSPVTTTKIRYYQPANMGPSGYATILWLTEMQAFGNPADITPPTISAVAASNITQTAATIRWTTNEAASSQVEYGTSISYGSSTTLDPSLVTSHSQNLVNLAPSTTYHFRVKSADAAGNLAVSGDNTFTTTSNSMQLLSQGVPVAASGTFPGYNTAVINDGVIAPRGGTSSTWASDQSANPHWVEFTFNSPVTVQRMRVYWAYNAYLARFMGSQQYNIQYWDATSGSYLNAATVNNTTQDSVTTTDFSPVTTTKIRYYQPANMGPSGYATILWLTEMQAFGSNPGNIGLGNPSNPGDYSDSLLMAKPNITGNLPDNFFLSQSYPNPFNAVTKIDYGLPDGAYVTFDIYDINGRHVAALLDGYQEAGYHSLTWNSSGEPSGIYLYRLKAGSFSQTRKMTVLK